MNLSGIDTEDLADDALDASAARRYAEYEMWGDAQPDEIQWLHAHPLEWVRALKAMRHEANMHQQNDAIALKAHPDRPKPGSPRSSQARWLAVRAEAKQVQLRRARFVTRVNERLAVASSLLPSASVPATGLAELVGWLLDIEAQIVDQPSEAKQRLAHVILRLAREAEERG